ncbi:helix-turn-helix family protein, partial [Acinetobacter baumannii 42057_3]|uniref:helix-turn-helix domain-containing protein n=2 Tax=Acinetobacter TaxID=469 RepID=UPI000460EFFF
MSVGDRIRSLRREKNWSQPVLAKQAGVTQSTISDLENNKKSTSAENMESIAEALGTTTSYLING